MKSTIRNLAATLASKLRITDHFERAAWGKVTVLCYHRILPAAARMAYHDPDLVVATEMFRAHCEALSARYRVMTLSAAADAIAASEPGSKPIAVLTFDDGYRDNFRYALPILDDLGLKATFFVISGLVDTQELPWYDRAGNALQAIHAIDPTAPDARSGLALAKAMSPEERQRWLTQLEEKAPAKTLCDDDLIMTSAQLRRMCMSGHEIGSHTVSHPLLPQCSDPELRFELEASRQTLAQIIDAPIASICYPNGDAGQRVTTAALRAGYTLGTVVHPGLNTSDNMHGLAIRRWFINQDRMVDRRGEPSSDLFRMEVVGLADKIFRRRAQA